jgi:lactoylglutathione lyase
MTGTASPRGLFEAHLTVANIDRSVAFYEEVVGLELAFEAPGRSAAFLWIGAPGRSMLGLWEIADAPVHLSLHIAFRTSVTEVMNACGRLRSLGVTPLSFFEEETDEPSVIGWMPAAAVYFRDPDGHLLEHLAMLGGEPRPELGIVPWSQWTGGGVDAGADRSTIGWHRGPRSELRNLFRLADDSPEQIDAYIDLGRVLVATDERGEIAGHLQLLPETRDGSTEIKSLAVQERFRRRGIGRRLVEHALAVCRDEGARVVTVSTAMADIDNLRFYQRRGFRAASIEPDAFTPQTGYPPAAAVNGIPIRDAVRFEFALDRA